MKRALLLLALLAAPAAPAAFDSPYWPATNQALYTNAMAADIFSNVLWRAYSAGQTSPVVCVATESVQWVQLAVTNLVFPNHPIVEGGVTSPLSITVTSRVCLATNVILTNVVTGFEASTPTGTVSGRVTIRDTLLEQMDICLESMMPSFSLADYTRPDDYSFDAWFAAGSPEDFPPASKADLFFRRGIGLVHTQINWVVTYADGSVLTNYSGRARWTKRRDRPFWWRAFEWDIVRGENHPGDYVTPRNVGVIDIPTSFGYIGVVVTNRVTARYPGFSGSIPTPLVSEFVDESYLHSIPELPTWRIIASSNATFSFGLGPTEFHLYATNMTSAWIWTNVCGTGVLQQVFVPSIPVITSRTQAADAAYFWIWPTYDMSVWQISTNVTASVALLWTNNLTVYEGSRRWDAVLYPEALDERRVAITNLFLVPWTSWSWTNTLIFTNFDYVNARTDLPPSVVYGEECFGMDWPGTNHVSDWPDATLAWWLNCDELAAIAPNVIPAVLGTNADGVATNAHAPEFTFAATASMGIFCQVEGHHDWCMQFFDPCAWDGYAVSGYRTVSGEVRVEGQNYSSQALVDNLWTGAAHRVHFYLRRAASDGNQPYHRVEISDWTTAQSILSTSRFDCAAMFPPVLTTNDIACSSGRELVTCCEPVTIHTNILMWDIYTNCVSVFDHTETNVTSVNLPANDLDCQPTRYDSYTTNRLDVYVWSTNAAEVWTNFYYTNLTLTVSACDTSTVLWTYQTNCVDDGLCPSGIVTTNSTVNTWYEWHNCGPEWDPRWTGKYNTETRSAVTNGESHSSVCTVYPVLTGNHIFTNGVNYSWNSSLNSSYEHSDTHRIDLRVLIEWRY